MTKISFIYTENGFIPDHPDDQIEDTWTQRFIENKYEALLISDLKTTQRDSAAVHCFCIISVNHSSMHYLLNRNLKLPENR